MRRDSLLVGAFAVLAFAQTLAYYLYLRDDPGNYNGAGAQGDQVAYIDLAQQVLHGTWQGAVHYMPGLPAVIALSQVVFGDPRLGIAVVQGIVFGGMVLLAARLAGQAFGEHATVWVAAAVGLNPAIGYYASQALTELLTGAVLLLLVVSLYAWGKSRSVSHVIWVGVLVGAAAYLRAEYLALAVLFGAVVIYVGGRRALGQAAVLLVATAVVMAPWVARYWITTGTPALYNESPFSNLVLMGTWFRVFDEQTFLQLQQIESAPGTRDEAIARAASVGPRPDLSQRYMEQVRGPYELPLGETLSVALENIRLNTRQFLVNHLVEAPILIWAGRTPLRQADAPNLPASGRYALWASELALVVLALWQAISGLRDRDTRTLSISFLAIVVFLTAVHVLIAVDERFTTPALPLVGLFAGGRLAELLRGRQAASVRYAA